MSPLADAVREELLFSRLPCYPGYSAMLEEEPLVPVFNPALVAILLHAEELKQAPLTEEEVLRIRDKAICVMTRRDVAEAMAETRGYADLDPENCWQEWQAVRREMGRTDESPADDS